MPCIGAHLVIVVLLWVPLRRQLLQVVCELGWHVVHIDELLGRGCMLVPTPCFAAVMCSILVHATERIAPAVRCCYLGGPRVGPGQEAAAQGKGPQGSKPHTPPWPALTVHQDHSVFFQSGVSMPHVLPSAKAPHQDGPVQGIRRRPSSVPRPCEQFTSDRQIGQAVALGLIIA